jgi:signal transduction histidine kinase
MSEALPTPPNVIAFLLRVPHAEHAPVDAPDVTLPKERLRIARELHDLVSFTLTERAYRLQTISKERLVPTRTQTRHSD